MTITLLLYLVEIIHNLDCLIGLIIGTFFVVLCILSFAWLVTNDGYSQEGHEQANNGLKTLFKYSYIPLILLIINIFVPDQKTMYLMLGTSYLQSTNLPVKVSEAIELKIDSIIDELKDKKENKK